MKIVIIGGVAGGATAAARARRENEEAEITIVERGPYISFANCGLPYYIGRDIKRKSDLLLQTPESFWDRYHIKVLVQTQVKAIHREAKTLLIQDEKGQRELPYDKLVISQGANPIIPPVPGREASHVFSLRDIGDMDKIDQYIENHKPKTAIIIGGGFIGIEMAEALNQRGLKVSLIEKGPQLMGQMDIEFGLLVKSELKAHEMDAHFNTAVTSIDDKSKTVTLENGQVLPADMVLFSIGVLPELNLVKDAGLKIGTQGGVVVDQYLMTSDPNIVAVGDMIELQHRVSGKTIRAPLAGPANRQARLAAHNLLSDKKMKYGGALGTAVIKVFKKTAAATGLSERLAKLNGFDIETVTVHPRNHAGYYPGSSQLTLKLVFEKKSGLLLGAQAFGEKGTEKRIDVLATAIAGKMTVRDLTELDLCYAPPYSSANDPVNMAGFVATNILDGFTESISAQDFLSLYNESRKQNDATHLPFTILDVRGEDELKMGALEGSLNVPLPQLRSKLDQFDKNKPIYVHCAVGFRGHLAYRILKQKGFNQVRNISGGYRSIDILKNS